MVPRDFFSFSFWFAPSEAQSTKPQWPQSLRAEDRDGAEVADATSQYLLALVFHFSIFNLFNFSSMKSKHLKFQSIKPTK